MKKWVYFYVNGGRGGIQIIHVTGSPRVYDKCNIHTRILTDNINDTPLLLFVTGSRFTKSYEYPTKNDKINITLFIAYNI